MTKYLPPIFAVLFVGAVGLLGLKITGRMECLSSAKRVTIKEFCRDPESFLSCQAWAVYQVDTSNLCRQ
jgi:hypothetical protein